MPIEPVKIPQNVYIEDRIVGPLTLKQIIISMLGMGFSYALWASIAKAYGSVPLHITVIVWIPAAIALMFAFVRINDLSMSHILFLTIERFSKPQIRVYGPRRGLTVQTRSFTAPKPQSHFTSQPQRSDADVAELSALLDQTPSDEEALQGLALPPRPVQKDRVTVNPLRPEDIEEVQSPTGRTLIHDILHPSTHA